MMHLTLNNTTPILNRKTVAQPTAKPVIHTALQSTDTVHFGATRVSKHQLGSGGGKPPRKPNSDKRKAQNAAASKKYRQKKKKQNNPEPPITRRGSFSEIIYPFNHENGHPYQARDFRNYNGTRTARMLNLDNELTDHALGQSTRKPDNSHSTIDPEISSSSSSSNGDPTVTRRGSFSEVDYNYNNLYRARDFRNYNGTRTARMLNSDNELTDHALGQSTRKPDNLYKDE